MFLHAACADGIVRVFKLDDATSKSFKYELFTYFSLMINEPSLNDIMSQPFLSPLRFLRINLPAGGHTSGVAFADEKSSIVVACPTFSGSSLYMYGEEKPKAATDGTQQTKLPLPEIKWEHHKIHDQRAVLTLFSTKATYGSADGSTIIVSCSEGMSYFYITQM